MYGCVCVCDFNISLYYMKGVFKLFGAWLSSEDRKISFEEDVMNGFLILIGLMKEIEGR